MPFLTTRELAPRPYLDPELINLSLDRESGHLPPTRMLLLYHPRDRALVYPVVNIIKALRINVYVHYSDPERSPLVDPLRDQELNTELALAQKMIILNTPGTPESGAFVRRMNGHLTDRDRVVVFPLTRSPETWEQQQAFSSLGYIRRSFLYMNLPEDWLVEYPGGRCMQLKDWIMKPNFK